MSGSGASYEQTILLAEDYEYGTQNCTGQWCQPFGIAVLGLKASESAA